VPGSRKILSDTVIQERLEIWEACGFSSRAAAQRIGIGRRAMDRFLDRYAHDAENRSTSTRWSDSLTQTDIIDQCPPPKRVRYLTDLRAEHTRVHAGFWRNLTAFAAHVDAEIKVSRFTYNKTLTRGPGKSVTTPAGRRGLGEEISATLRRPTTVERTGADTGLVREPADSPHRR
jgi:hypothetical protein